jgi:hypothetical protein
MRKSLGEFRIRALARPDVRREYVRLARKFALLDQLLKSRSRPLNQNPPCAVKPAAEHEQ